MMMSQLPYICLMWIGLGFFLILIGVFCLAHHTEKLFPMVLDEKQEAINLESNLEKQTASYHEILKLSDEGLGEEDIAKKLKIGVGEVRLILSLYSMR